MVDMDKSIVNIFDFSNILADGDSFHAFISMYIYLLWKVVTWFMALEAPTMEQAGLVSVIVGAGAAWFGLYVNSSSTKFESVEVKTTMSGSEAKLEDKREAPKRNPLRR